MLGGALLVGLHMLAEYGALQLLNYPTLTTAILQQYATVFNGPAATLLALRARAVLPGPALASSSLCVAGVAGLGWGRAPAGRPNGSRSAGSRPPGRRARPGRRWRPLARASRSPAWLAGWSGARRPASTSAELAGAAGDDTRARRGRGRARHRGRGPGGVARGAPPRTAHHADRAQHLHRQRDARHRDRPGAGLRVDPRGARRSTRPCSLLLVGYVDPVPAARRGRASAAPSSRCRPDSTTSPAASGAPARAPRRASPCRWSCPDSASAVALVSLAVSTELTATLLLSPIGHRRRCRPGSGATPRRSPTAPRRPTPSP